MQVEQLQKLQKQKYSKNSIQDRAKSKQPASSAATHALRIGGLPIQPTQKLSSDTKIAKLQANSMNAYHREQLSQKRILVVTHGGFIMEFMNAVRVMDGKQPIENNSARNTSIYIIQFALQGWKKGLAKPFTSQKGGAKPKIIPTVIKENDNAHLKNLSKDAKTDMITQKEIKID